MSGKQVVDLSYDAYIPLAIRTLTKIAEKTLQQWSPEKSQEAYVCKIAIAHRLGPVGIGQESVVIAISAGHRKEGWLAAEDVLENVKGCAEIWKNERYQDGSALWQANDGEKPSQFT
jgi:molybdopterin synthase catalytic subunit